MERRQLLAVVGCFVLSVGVFAPLISLPIMGSVNYFRNGEGDGTIVLALAGISFLAALCRKYVYLWLTGLSSLGMLAFTFFNVRNRLSEMKMDLAKDLAGNPFRGLADLAAESIQMQWGWAVLLAGALMLLIAAHKREEGKNGQTDHGHEDQSLPDWMREEGKSRQTDRPWNLQERRP